MTLGASVHVPWVSDAIQPPHLLSSPSPLPSIFPSIRVFSNESVLHIRWPKYWSFSISPSNEYSGLISFRMDWLDLLAVQGTLKSLLQHHSSKASILHHLAFFIVLVNSFPGGWIEVRAGVGFQRKLKLLTYYTRWLFLRNSQHLLTHSSSHFYNRKFSRKSSHWLSGITDIGQ